MVSKAQISMEYLAVVGVSLLFIIPLTVVFLDQSEGFEDDIRAVQLEKVSNELIDAAEEVYYLGSPTQKKLQLHFPENLDSVVIEEQAIVFYVDRGGSVVLYAVDTELPLNLTGTIGSFPGLHVIIVKSVNDQVVISDLT